MIEVMKGCDTEDVTSTILDADVVTKVSLISKSIQFVLFQVVEAIDFSRLMFSFTK